MAKKGPKKTTKKEDFNLEDFLNSENLNSEPKDKDLSWVPLSKGFSDSLGLPGFPRGFVSLVRGFSNTGKSTAFYEAIKGAQKVGDFAVVIETEGNWNVEHAKLVGVEFDEIVDESTGVITYKPKGFMLIRQHDLYDRYKNYDHAESKMKTKPTRFEPVIEDVALFMSEMLQKQEDGMFPKNLCFLWDSIGTLNCYKSAISNASNNMWNAGAMGVFQPIVNFKIPSSRVETSEFTNTFICVQKIWLDNMNGGVIKHKGGEFMYFNSRIIVHLGGIISHGTKNLKAMALGQDFQYGIETKIKCVKNHINGIEKSGKICSTPHGYVSPDDLNKYKTEHRKFIHEALNADYNVDINFTEEDGSFENGDISE